MSPPVQPNLLGLVDRAYDEPDSNGKELDLREGYLDITRDGKPLVEDAVQYVNEAADPLTTRLELASHGFSIASNLPTSCRRMWPRKTLERYHGTRAFGQEKHPARRGRRQAGRRPV